MLKVYSNTVLLLAGSGNPGIAKLGKEEGKPGGAGGGGTPDNSGTGGGAGGGGTAELGKGGGQLRGSD